MIRNISATLLILLCACHLSCAQSIEILDLQIAQQDDVVLTFRINPDNSLRERYNVTVYALHDGYSNPLDLQLEDLAPSRSHTVTFSGSEKIGNFAGDLQFKLVADATVFPLKILPSTRQSMKRAKSFTINWYDHQNEGPYDVELVQDGFMAHSIARGTTSTSVIAEIPKSLQKGTYALRVTPVGNPSAQSEPFPFRLKGSSAGLLAGLGVAAGGAIAYLVLFQGGGGGDPVDPVDNDLPDPPGTPN